MMMQRMIAVICLALVAGIGDSHELMRRNDHEEMQVEIDYSGQRRQLGWGSGGFSWILCKYTHAQILECRLS